MDFNVHIQNCDKKRCLSQMQITMAQISWHVHGFRRAGKYGFCRAGKHRIFQTGTRMCSFCSRTFCSHASKRPFFYMTRHILLLISLYFFSYCDSGTMSVNVTVFYISIVIENLYKDVNGWQRCNSDKSCRNKGNLSQVFFCPSF